MCVPYVNVVLRQSVSQLLLVTDILFRYWIVVNVGVTFCWNVNVNNCPSFNFVFRSRQRLLS